MDHPQRTTHQCRNCPHQFTVLRSFANRNAVIRYCFECKRARDRDLRPSDRSGAASRISKFSTSGTVSIMAG